MQLKNYLPQLGYSSLYKLIKVQELLSMVDQISLNQAKAKTMSSMVQDNCVRLTSKELNSSMTLPCEMWSQVPNGMLAEEVHVNVKGFQMKTKPLATPLEEDEDEGFLHKTNRVPNPNQARDNIWEVVSRQDLSWLIHFQLADFLV